MTNQISVEATSYAISNFSCSLLTNSSASEQVGVQVLSHSERTSPRSQCPREVYLGNPSQNFAAYKEVEGTLKAAFAAASAIPTKIILPVFAPQNDGADGFSRAPQPTTFVHQK